MRIWLLLIISFFIQNSYCADSGSGIDIGEAIRKKNVDLVCKFLNATDEDINLLTTGRFGEALRLLAYSIREHSNELVELLLLRGANPDLSTKLDNSHFSNMFEFAAAMQNVRALRLLIEHNANITDEMLRSAMATSKICHGSGSDVLQFLLQYKAQKDREKFVKNWHEYY